MPPDFLDTVNQYLEYYFALHAVSQKTKLNYESFVKALQIARDVPLTRVNHDFAEDLFIKLRATMGITNASRIIELCKRVMEYARKKKLILVNEIADFKTGRDKVKDVVHLEENELQKFIYPQLQDQELEIALDLYIFQSNTGMSFGDLQRWKLIKDHVGTWFYNFRSKGNNSNQYWVPANEDALRIVEKYNGRLPNIHLVTYNRKLKKAAERFGIKKNLSSHTARKTFATRMYEKGWSLESIADMMGITVQVLITHYIKKSRKRLENEVLLRSKEPVPAKVIELKVVN